MTGRRWGAVVMGLAGVAALVGATLVVPRSPAGAAGELRVTVLSGRTDTVTGGDALVGVRGADTAPVRFSTGGERLTARRARPGQWVVAGIPVGRHALVARAGTDRGEVTVTNHTITGPVFSGPHLPLLACSTQQNGLGPPTDADCSAPTKVTWFARDATTERFAPIDPATFDPADPAVAHATVQGRSVPFVVRTESGVVNRSVYWISVLDPDPAATRFDPAGWNRRLVYRFGGGCGQSYGQGAPLGINTVVPSLLGEGYAVATATFNTFQVQCNDVLSAETAMMVEERFAEHYGRPVHTIGDGGSGGAIQQLLVAQDYPGILDAIAPSLPFPDAVTISPGVTDCGLLAAYFRTPSGAALTADQRTAISGYRTWASCQTWITTFLGGVVPTDGCDPAIPAAEIYDATSNPHGIRCALSDANRNQLGVDPATGFARRPLDNVGVQYGLEAVRAGTITPDQFLDLNEHVGGYDVDGTIVAAREEARPADLRRAYAFGRVLQRDRTTTRTPTITTNVYTDALADIHTRFRAFSIRDRLRSDTGAVDRNQVVWTRPSGGDLAAGLTGAGGDVLALTRTLDAWLTSGHRPAAARDTCTGPDGTVVVGLSVDALPPGPTGQCNNWYPVFGDPRTAAGGPQRGDVLKCRRRAPRASDYGVPFTADQLARLRRAFPAGVCDWSRPGVGQVAMAGTWIDYSRPASPVPLPAG